MSVQLIFCVETNKKTKSDWYYLNSLIQQFYCVDTSVKLSVVYMDGKNKYKQKSVLNDIKELHNMFRGDNTYVIYCFDTDDIVNSPKALSFMKEVEDYCLRNVFDLVWFNRDIENVLLGKSVSNSEKATYAIDYVRKKSYVHLNVKMVEKENRYIEGSNLFNVLDKYLTRKNIE